MNGDDAERRLHWMRLARELGQEDDFRALLDGIRREALEYTASVIEREVEALDTGEGSMRFRRGRKTMRAEVLKILRT